ncbi:MAG: hypothetical protein DRH17_06575 [Deltaproteobacteria bacterium]|nr:MAG: hypothetical protein DRH17_06575 [Deltaproteobacteria bacterium]
MAHEQPINLDAIAAGAGFEIAGKVFQKSEKKDVNWITKSLGVLQEQGVYAFFLYLKAQNKHVTEALSEHAASLLGQQGINILGSGDILDEIRGGLAKDIDKLLLGHSVLTQALIYARYHAKALPDSKAPTGEEDTP